MKTKITLLGLALFLLSASILATIYLAWLLYPLEIWFLDLETATAMPAAELSTHFQVLLNYLTKPWESVLEFPSLSSSAGGLKHFRDVKYLFHMTQCLCLLSLPALYLWRQQIHEREAAVLSKNWLFTLGVSPLFLLLLSLVLGFDQFFVLFHQILFPGDVSWLFDPRTDPVIHMLPQEFFLHCFVVCFLVYQLLVWSCWRLSMKSGRSC